MYIYSVSIPVPSYEENKVVYHPILFSSPPTKESVITVINDIEDSYDVYYQEEVFKRLSDLLFSVNQIKNWKEVNIDNTSLTEFVIVALSCDKVVKAPFTWKFIKVY